MIDIENDDLLPFGDIAKWFKKKMKRKITAAQIHRWRSRGISAVKLESVLIGGKRYSSIKALNEFFTASTEARDGAAK